MGSALFKPNHALVIALITSIVLSLTLPAARPAGACVCGSRPHAETGYLRNLLATSDLLVVGQVLHSSGTFAPPTAQSSEGEALTYAPRPEIQAIVRVERWYGREAPTQVEVLTDSGSVGCGYGAIIAGGRHFLALQRNGNTDTYYASYCTSLDMVRSLPGNDREGQYQGFLDALDAMAPTGYVSSDTTPEPVPVVAGTNGDHAPSLVFMAAYFAASLAALAALIYLQRTRSVARR